MEFLTKIINYLDELLTLVGGALVAVFVYRNEIKPFTVLSVLIYFGLSVIIGVNVGGFIAEYILNASAKSTHYVIGITQVFGLGICAIIKEQAPKWLDDFRNRWINK